MTTPIYSSGRIVGSVDRGVFKKTVSASRHFLKHPPAIALSVESVQQAKRAGADTVSIFDTESRTTYTTALTFFEQHATAFERGGYERQAFMPLRYWQNTTHPEDGGQQMPLFER